MGTLTPFQCFLIGGAASLAVFVPLVLLGWRHLATLRRRLPEYLTAEAIEARKKRPRELELLERIAENQEVMIGLLRQVLEEPVR